MSNMRFAVVAIGVFSSKFSATKNEFGTKIVL